MVGNETQQAADRRSQALPSAHEGVRREAGVDAGERESHVSGARSECEAVERFLHRVADEKGEATTLLPTER